MSGRAALTVALCSRWFWCQQAKIAAAFVSSLALSFAPGASSAAVRCGTRVMSPVTRASSRRPVADGLGIYRPHFAHAGKILLGAGFQRCMTLKGGSSVGLQAAGENVDLTTNAEEQADAKALKEKMQARPVNSPAPAGALGRFPPVQISKEGRFKYVLIEAFDDHGNKRHLVRGDIRVGYHVYCAQPTVDELRSQSLFAKVLGGGRMEHYPQQKLLKIYGYSHSFGMEDKALTAAVCKQTFPQYTITTSREGY